MPYIPQSKRGNVRAEGVLDDGELNYAITVLLNNQIDKRGMSYKTINSLIGALECAKLELYRRIAAPYEDKKIRENGDVYFE